MSAQILYLGDTAINQAASYLAGIMTHFGIGFDYVASDEKCPASLADKNYNAIIISDYPAKNFTPEQFAIIEQKASAGMGVMMIGGWESFVGADGKYNETILADILPVKMQDDDDRVNCPQPCLVEITNPHPIINDLPFDDYPPGIGGYNKFSAKSDARIILSSRQIKVSKKDNYEFIPASEAQPLLVIGEYASARTLAFASDVAPHWVGGFVDWGNQRINACAATYNAEAIEVGDLYAKLFANMIKWVAKINF